MNNYYDFGGYSTQNFGNQMNTNVTFVTSIDEALFRATYRNSDMVFFHQDKPIFYRVKVDSDGRKSWAQFDYSAPNAEANVAVTKGDLKELYDRLEVLEKQVKGEVTNE